LHVPYVDARRLNAIIRCQVNAPLTDSETLSAAAAAAADDDDVTYVHLHWADAHHTRVVQGVSLETALLVFVADVVFRATQARPGPPLSPAALAFCVPIATHGLASDGGCRRHKVRSVAATFTEKPICSRAISKFIILSWPCSCCKWHVKFGVIGCHYYDEHRTGHTGSQDYRIARFVRKSRFVYDLKFVVTHIRPV